MPTIDTLFSARQNLRRQSPLRRARTLAIFLLMSLLAPVTAYADCDVPEGGIPEDAAFKFDVGGARAALAKAGIGVGGAYYGESFYNWGGFDEGGEYDGVLELYVNADMKKLGLWDGLCFFANGYQIHGNSITAANIGSLMPVSSLEARDATRLFEMWFEQKLFQDKVAVKVGQLAADAEFLLSEGGGYFLNGTWGWPSITAADLPSGGPAYPLATPGVRVAVTRTIASASWSRSTMAILRRLAPTKIRKSATITGWISSLMTILCSWLRVPITIIPMDYAAS